MSLSLRLTLALLAIAPAAPAAAAGTDCPLARQPYSSRSPLLDLRLDPAAKAVLDREAPGLDRPPGMPAGASLPPGFGAIVTPLFLLKQRPDGPTLAARLDRALGGVKLTRAAIRARCARYDEVRPKLPATIRRPAILVFDKINGFRDSQSIDAATAALKAMAARRGWTLVFSDKGGVFNARDLAGFDAVVWNNVSGDALTVKQRTAFRRWIERGGGYAGIHGSAGDPVSFWDWYVDTLVGARFKGHPMAPQFQEARVAVDDRSSAIARGLPAEWRMREEWYSFEKSPRASGARILLTLDEGTYSPVGWGGADIRMGDHPLAWTRCLGSGRSFYSAIGHRPESYVEPNSLRLLEQGIAWAAGQGETACADGREVMQ